jgi:predicted DCC family thiol-disulfide oxidoreductase YuxK
MLQETSKAKTVTQNISNRRKHITVNVHMPLTICDDRYKFINDVRPKWFKKKLEQKPAWG